MQQDLHTAFSHATSRPIHPHVQQAMRQVVDTARMIVWMTDVRDICIYLNREVRSLFRASDEIYLSDWFQFMHPEDREWMLTAYQVARQAHEEYQFEYRLMRSDGSTRWMLGSGAPRFSEAGEFLGYNGTIVDVSRQQELVERLAASEAELRRSEARFRSLTHLSSDWYWETDEQDRFTFFSKGLQGLFGIVPEQLLGMRRTELAADPDDPSLQAYHDSIARRRPFRNLVFAVHLPPDSRRYCFSISGEPVYEDGVFRGFHGVGTDITERKKAESQLEQLATHDALTGLPNRALVNQRLQAMLDTAPPEDSIAVMFIDLDRFKEVNDSMGHALGDILLGQVALRLQKSMRPDDIVARLGGDEFVVAAHCPGGRESASAIAGELLATLSSPFDIEGHEVFVSASIGISMFAEDGSTKDILFQNADVAMYRAKAGGRNGYRFFEAEMSVEAKSRMVLEHSLRRALERNEFELEYQPRVNLKTMAVVGMEALVRWNHPQFGRIPPMKFIPIAEERGLIGPIGQWVLEEACRQTARLAATFRRRLHVSVNLSARQLKCANLAEQVENALKKASLPGELLELELTESALIDDMDASVDVLKKLKRLGILLSIDDFGTGYSGLSYLRRFPVDILKLDRSFVRQQSGEASSSEFIKAFVGMSHALKMSVVAEGIETPETLQLLRDAACDEGQGYLFSQPLSLSELEDFLSRLPVLS